MERSLVSAVEDIENIENIECEDEKWNGPLFPLLRQTLFEGRSEIHGSFHFRRW